MRDEDKRTLVMLAASVAGVAAGHWLREAQAPPPSTLHPEPEPSAEPEARSRLAERGKPVVTAGSLFAAMSLSRQIGDRLAIPPERYLAQGLLAFGVTAGMTYLSERLRAVIPGSR